MLQEKRRTHTRRSWSNALAIATIAISTIAAGCSDGVKTVPVKGRVTLGGGDWPRKGIIYFACSEPAEGYSRRSGVGDFDVDGAFVVTSYKKGDGLTPGKYVVNIECWEVPPSMGRGPRPPRARSPSSTNAATQAASPWKSMSAPGASPTPTSTCRSNSLHRRGFLRCPSRRREFCEGPQNQRDDGTCRRDPRGQDQDGPDPRPGLPAETPPATTRQRAPRSRR